MSAFGLFVWLVCGVLILWVLYMATFRPGDLVNLVEAERKRKEAEHQRTMQRTCQMGKALNLGVNILGRFLKK